MVKKTMAEDQPASAAGLFDSELAATVKSSAQQIWLAGLGAFSKAQEEGGKVFDALVKEGIGLQKKTQAVAEEKISEVSARMTDMAGDVQAKAGQQWDRLESIFDERTAKAMSKLGVPSKKDIEALVERVDALAARVGELVKQRAPRTASQPAAKTTKAASAEAAKPAAPRAPRKSTAD